VCSDSFLFVRLLTARDHVTKWQIWFSAQHLNSQTVALSLHMNEHYALLTAIKRGGKSAVTLCSTLTLIELSPGLCIVSAREIFTSDSSTRVETCRITCPAFQSGNKLSERLICLYSCRLHVVADVIQLVQERSDFVWLLKVCGHSLKQTWLYVLYSSRSFPTLKSFTLK